MQAADDARAARVQRLTPAAAQEEEEEEVVVVAPSLQLSEGGSSPRPAETTVSLMPHVGVQVIPPINFGMVEDGLYRWLAQIAACPLS